MARRRDEKQPLSSHLFDLQKNEEARVLADDAARIAGKELDAKLNNDRALDICHAKMRSGSNSEQNEDDQTQVREQTHKYTKTHTHTHTRARVQWCSHLLAF